MDRLDCHDWGTDGYPGEFVYGDDVYIDDYYMDERLLPDVDHPDYWVSTKERVWSNVSNRFIYGGSNGKMGYIDVSLKTPNGRKHKYMHQMMGQAFIPNPKNLPLIRHKDDNPSNNHLDNLEWGTYQDNTQDCIDHGRFRYFTEEDRESAMKKRRDPVVAVNLSNGSEQEFESQCEAGRRLGVSQSSISEVIRGERRSVNGYYFYRPDDGLRIELSDYRYTRHRAPIKATNIDTGTARYFHGQTEAAKALGMSIASVCTAVNGKTYGAKGYRFEYADEEEFENEGY